MTLTTPPRKPLTDTQRAKLFADHGGICHICQRKIMATEKWDDEHLVSRWLKPENCDDLSNRAPAHRLECHPAKSAEEATQRAKIKRERRKISLDPESRADREARAAKRKPIPSRKLESRGFGKQHRPFPKPPEARP